MIRKKQCKACPWKKSTVPDEDIPGGYCAAKHANLEGTIADGADPSSIGRPLQMMACHESEPGAEYPCVGWLVHQLGPGNNLALRFAALDGRYKDLEVFGEQHECFEDTLPSHDDG